jgi:hypothetical protein
MYQLRSMIKKDKHVLVCVYKQYEKMRKQLFTYVKNGS